MKIKVEDIINQNISLQSIQRELVKIGIYKPSLELFKSSRFLSTFNNWDKNKQENFMSLIGGKRYLKLTRNYIENYQNKL